MRHLIVLSALAVGAILATAQRSPSTAFRENQTGVPATGRWVDVTVLSLDPFTASPSALLGGTVTMTIVGGRIVHQR